MNNEVLSAKKFQRDAFSALNDIQLRRNFKRAMDGLMKKRQAVLRMLRSGNNSGNWDVRYVRLR